MAQYPQLFQPSPLLRQQPNMDPMMGAMQPPPQQAEMPGQEDEYEDQVDPKVTEAVLRMSESPSKQKELDRQRAMSNSLVGKATNLQSPGRRGGPFAALAQGMMGYAGGKGIKENMAANTLLQGENKTDRGTYLNAAMGSAGKRPRRQSPASQNRVISPRLDEQFLEE